MWTLLALNSTQQHHVQQLCSQFGEWKYDRRQAIAQANGETKAANRSFRMQQDLCRHINGLEHTTSHTFLVNQFVLKRTATEWLKYEVRVLAPTVCVTALNARWCTLDQLTRQRQVTCWRISGPLFNSARFAIYRVPFDVL